MEQRNLSETATELAQIKSALLKRSKGNPGAINVMTAGVMSYGRQFFDRLAYHGLEGSDIWRLFKDVCDCKFSRMTAVLESDTKVNLPVEGA